MQKFFSKLPQHYLVALDKNTGNVLTADTHLYKCDSYVFGSKAFLLKQKETNVDQAPSEESLSQNTNTSLDTPGIENDVLETAGEQCTETSSNPCNDKGVSQTSNEPKQQIYEQQPEGDFLGTGEDHTEAAMTPRKDEGVSKTSCKVQEQMFEEQPESDFLGTNDEQEEDRPITSTIHNDVVRRSVRSRKSTQQYTPEGKELHESEKKMRVGSSKLDRKKKDTTSMDLPDFFLVEKKKYFPP